MAIGEADGAVPVARPWIVGIGASAGGVEALRELLPSLVTGPVTYVVAQHMSPAHPSLLLQVLSRETRMPVVEIANGMKVSPGTVYVASPNTDVEIRGGSFATREAAPRISPQPSIDVLLTSISTIAGDRGIAVLLSGTGSDGADGFAAVRRGGGRTIAQDPTTARYRDMPSAAIDRGVVDFIRPPAEIGGLIEAIMSGNAPDETGGRFADDQALNQLASEVRRATGWDLAAYKDGTLGRQLKRRLTALDLATTQDYLSYLRENPAEAGILRDSMLINVTRFLRDRASYDALARALGPLAAAKPPDEPLRAWVAGCATGEEAYSIAILLAEACRQTGTDAPPKVFATDISDTAMEKARRGSYPLSALDEMPDEWVERYFDIDGETATVSKQLRDMLVIARHDVTRDPPLVRMDLVSCRNLLIYLVDTVQEQVLGNLLAALRSGGLLFLGRSESMPADSDLVTAVSAGNRIFRREQGGVLASYSPTRYDGSGVVNLRARTSRRPRDGFRDQVRDQLLADFGPPSVLIDPDGVPVHQIGEVGRYLSVDGLDGDITVVGMVLPAMRTEVSALISRVGRESGSSASHPVTVRRTDGDYETVVIHAVRLVPDGDARPHLLLSFVSAPTAVRSAAPATVTVGLGEDELRDQIASLDAELTATREHLQAVVEELESSNEELQAMNEELQASGEELQATNEELETTNEELQATNEELTTVNETLQVRSAELSDTNGILNAIQEAVHTAIVLVDTEQRVLRFSPLAVRVFGLVPRDIGSPLRGLPAHLDVVDLHELIAETMARGEGTTLETRTSTATYLLQVMPYVFEGRICGAVLSFSDITDLDHARRDLMARNEEFQVLAEGVPYALYRSDPQRSHLEYLSPTAERMFGIAPELVDTALLLDHVHPDDRDSVVLAFATGGDIAIDYRIIGADGVVRDVRDISHVSDVLGTPTRIGALIEVTDLVLLRQAAEREKRRAEGAFVHSGVAKVWLRSDGVVMEANNAVRTLLGRVADVLVGAELASIVSPTDVEGLRAAIASLSEDAGSMITRHCSVSAGDRVLECDIVIGAIAVGDRDGRELLVSIHDVTAAYEATERLRQREHQLDIIFAGSGAPMVILGRSGMVLRPNQAMCALLGYAEEDLVGRPFADLSHVEDRALDRGLFEELLSGSRDRYTVDKRFLTADGRTVWGRLSVTRAGEDRKDPIICSLLDVTAEREREANALARAQSDPLTGVANRVLAFDRLHQAVLRNARSGEPVSVLVIDLDGFKGINDRLGHEVGDTVLRAVADRLMSVTRDVDTVARLGGDEFLVLASHRVDEGSDAAMILAERVMDAMIAPIPVQLGGVEADPVILTCSVGIAHCPIDGSDVEELVRKADIAMYSAKRAGGSGVGVYSARLVDEARVLAGMRSELLVGLDTGQFVPYYQPLVDARTQLPVGFEVLARWQHPERGLLPPGEFIDLMERFNQLGQLSEQLISRAARDAAQFRQLVPGLTMSVNVDPQQLRSSDLPRLMRSAIGNDLSGWVIEVTERAELGEDVAARDGLARLRRDGAQLSLDDFGTGYSSVLSLKSWAFDEVKIDRAFVADIHAAGSRDLVVTMLGMVRALGARAVVEGIEDAAQAQVLREIGADVLQGYLFGRPMASAEALAWLTQNALV